MCGQGWRHREWMRKEVEGEAAVLSRRHSVQAAASGVLFVFHSKRKKVKETE